MVAFHFPPLAGSSGIQRALRFVQHLPANGWEPIVLSAHPRAYESVADDLIAEVPPGTIVKRAFALDTARHLSIAGRYPGSLALPDRWRTWATWAVPAGMRLIRRYRPDAIWSTFPIASAHLIAHELHRRSGLPLIADFRDPMAQDGYPTDKRVWQAYQRIEASVASAASRLVMVTPSALELYKARYASLPPDRFALIENGYDEDAFAAAENDLDRTPLNPGFITLLHSGIVYPTERDPSALFAALARLRAGPTGALLSRLRIRFRAPVHGPLIERLAAQAQVQDLIEILPAVPYRQALQEMLRADGLMVMQAANCNEQVPAKLYEYLRAGRPVLGLADPAGDTGRVMRSAGVAPVAALEDSPAIESATRRLLEQLAAGTPPSQITPEIRAMSRRGRTQQLAALLDGVCSAQARAHAGPLLRGALHEPPAA